MENIKRILCYGDSNTWGYIPRKATRFAPDVRWTGVVQKILGDEFLIIEEGLNGRTTNCEDPIEPYRNGYDYLIPCLLSHRPLDLVILFLGTNNLKIRHSLSAYDIAHSAGMLIDTIRRVNYLMEVSPPDVLLISPPIIGKLTDFAEMFEGANEKSRLFKKHFETIAKLYDCHFLDAASVVTSSDLDGVHLDEENHKKLGNSIAEKVKEIYFS